MWRAGSLAAEVAKLPGGETVAPKVAAVEAELARTVAPALCGACGARWDVTEVAGKESCPACDAPRTRQ